ncbi:MAG: hypothetical protein ACKO83_10100 [Roseiflexaceae bacterium]
MNKWWVVIIACGICVIAVLLWRMTGRFSSFHEAIAADMTSRGIAVRQVEVLHTWPDTVNTITYAANLRVILTSGAIYWGRLDCLGWQKQCKYRITALQQTWIPLADLVVPSVWWEWWQTIASRLRL